MKRFAMRGSLDLTKEIPWGEGQTYLRCILVVDRSHVLSRRPDDPRAAAAGRVEGSLTCEPSPAVLVGYLIFAISAALLFSLTGQNPHAAASSQFMMLTTIYGMVFAAVGGYVAEWLAQAPRGERRLPLGVVIAVGARVSLITSPRQDARWSQIAALVLMAPSALIGGWLAVRARAG